MADTQKIVLAAVSEVLEKAGFSGDVLWHQDGVFSRVVITSPEHAVLIGKDGQNLDAIEHLARLVALRRIENDQRLPDFYVDVNDYRKARHEALVHAARASADRVRLSGRAEALAPMNSYERKIIHSELATLADVRTESIGAEPNRRIVIKRAGY